MGVRILFLTAFIATSGLPCVQPKIQTGQVIADEKNADGKVQQSFRSLFDSLSKNDLGKTDKMRDLLEREALKAQKAFDTMKDGLRLAREKNANRQRNLNKNGDHGEKAAVFKRETDVKTEAAGTPEQPAEQVEFCSKLKANMSNQSAAGFIKTLNVHWRMGLASSGTPEPDTNELCVKRLSELLQLCDLPTETLVHVKRPFGDDEMSVGAFDVITKEQKNANIVAKLRWRKRACVSLSPLLKCLESTTVNQLYPDEKIMALALTVSKVVEATPIIEWIALFFQNGEIVDTELYKDDLKRTCLTAKEFSKITFKNKPIIQYFNGWEAIFDNEGDLVEEE